ncbi:hypothetical protein ACFQ0D_04845, partial [Micromonospora zhanjiangensis]
RAAGVRGDAQDAPAHLSGAHQAGRPVRLAGLPGTGDATNLYGGAALRPASDGTVELPADGPTFQVWRLS